MRVARKLTLRAIQPRPILLIALSLAFFIGSRSPAQDSEQPSDEGRKILQKISDEIAQKLGKKQGGRAGAYGSRWGWTYVEVPADALTEPRGEEEDRMRMYLLAHFRNKEFREKIRDVLNKPWSADTVRVLWDFGMSDYLNSPLCAQGTLEMLELARERMCEPKAEVLDLIVYGGMKYGGEVAAEVKSKLDDLFTSFDTPGWRSCDIHLLGFATGALRKYGTLTMLPDSFYNMGDHGKYRSDVDSVVEKLRRREHKKKPISAGKQPQKKMPLPAAEPLQEDEMASEVIAGWQLSVRFHKEYQLGRPMPVRLILANRSQDYLCLTFLGMGIRLNCDLEITAKDCNRRLLRTTDYGSRIRNCSFFWDTSPDGLILKYPPGEGQTREIDLAQVFEFPEAGKYYLAVGARVKKEGMKLVMREIEDPPIPSFPGCDDSSVTRWRAAWEQDNDPRESVFVWDIPIRVLGLPEKQAPKPVRTPPTLPPGREPGPPGKTGYSWPVPVGVVVALLAGVIALLLLLRRRGRIM